MTIDMAALASDVDEYVKCWKNQPFIKLPAGTRVLMEDNDFGYERYQLLSRYSIADFEHAQLLELVALLTKSLQGQINRDHKILWAWVASTAAYLSPKEFDHDWRAAFAALTQTLLLPSTRGAGKHVAAVCGDKHLIAAPLSFAVLEGALRRANHAFMTPQGKVTAPFTIGSTNYAVNGSINRVRVGLLLFEQQTAQARAGTLKALKEMYQYVQALHGLSSPAPDIVDGWRNDLLHGAGYWTSRTPIVANLLCLIALDAIPASTYDSARKTRLAPPFTSNRHPYPFEG